MVDILMLSFVMHGARDAIANGLEHVEQQVRSIEEAVVENPGLAFDLAKTLVESVCRTVLSERQIAHGYDDDLPRLFKAAAQSLPFLPAGASAESEIRKSLAQTLGGLHTAVHGICELRNQCGFASHGSGEPRPAMESAQALLAAEAADAIVGFLHRVHKQAQARATGAQLTYEDNFAFNESVDELHPPVQVFDEEFAPSRVLFEMAPEPYRIYLAGFASEDTIAEAEVAPEDPVEVVP